MKRKAQSGCKSLTTGLTNEAISPLVRTLGTALHESADVVVC